ncbi:ATP-binding protein [Streptomyces sp. gCLA4]|uniref:ATP-binding protein n=1 Tax=Streptomyces sp. gCLA4 TaxID=1873416 RepID=UPI002180A5EC|nr:ATP-binding protein [Streptomyces sp. gCLA4]
MRRVLKDLGLSGDVVSDGVLAVSELVANAHEHACGPYEVHVRSAAGRYICEIHDRDPLLPAVTRRRRTPNRSRRRAGCSSSVDGACAS